MERMPSAFIPEKAQGVEATIQFHFTGNEESDWVAAIKEGACTVEPGTTPAPTLSLTAESQDYLDVVTGQMDGMKAFMQGKLRLSGDLNLAMKMLGFFKLG
jgi:putative sterol carrier protein